MSFSLIFPHSKFATSSRSFDCACYCKLQVCSGPSQRGTRRPSRLEHSARHTQAVNRTPLQAGQSWRSLPSQNHGLGALHCDKDRLDRYLIVLLAAKQEYISTLATDTPPLKLRLRGGSVTGTEQAKQPIPGQTLCHKGVCVPPFIVSQLRTQTKYRGANQPVSSSSSFFLFLCVCVCVLKT